MQVDLKRTISFYMTVKLCVCRGVGKYGVFDDGTRTVPVSGGHFLFHCEWTVLFTFRKRKGEFLNLYSAYDGRNIHMDNSPSPKNTHQHY